MDTTDATTLLRETERLRHRVRLDLGGGSFSLLLFGALQIGGAGVALGVSGRALAVYWAVAGPLGGLVTIVFFRRRTLAAGVEPHGALPTATGAAIVVGSFVGYALGLRVDLTFAAAMPFVVISAGSLVLARLQRDVRLAVGAAGLGLSAFALAVSDLTPTAVSGILSLVYGTCFVVYGLGLLADERRAT